VYLLPVILVLLHLVVDLLGVACSGDLLDNAAHECNTGGEVMWVLLVLTLLSTAVATALLLWAQAAFLLRRVSRSRDA
jgi:hypothetical protein